jgi:hypothetical protein
MNTTGLKKLATTKNLLIVAGIGAGFYFINQVSTGIGQGAANFGTEAGQGAASGIQDLAVIGGIVLAAVLLL